MIFYLQERRMMTIIVQWNDWKFCITKKDIPASFIDIYEVFSDINNLIIIAMNFILKQLNKNFATLALAEHNGKILSKNTLKLLTASSKLND